MQKGVGVRYPRNNEIDILRGLAILLVLFRHSHYLLPTFITHYPMFMQGTWSGVDLFFVISGFVITLGLLPLMNAYFAGTYSARQVLSSFFVRRFFRLLPLSWLLLGLNLFFALVYNQSGQFGVWNEMRHEVVPILLYYYNYFIYAGGSSHLSWYWGLSIEEQFYVLYPFVLISIRSDRVKLFGMGIAIAVINLILRPFTTPDFNLVQQKLWPSFTTPSHLRFDCILAGCFMGIAYLKASKGNLRASLQAHLPFARIISFVAFLGVAIFGAILPHFELTGYPAIMICSMTLIGLAAFELNLTPHFGMSKFLNWLSRRSYAVYVIHMMVIHLFNETWFRAIGKQKNQLTWIQGGFNLVFAYGLSLFLAEWAYQLIEKRGIRLGRGISEDILSGGRDKSETLKPLIRPTQESPWNPEVRL